MLANPVAVWLGLVSYGVYIWHKAFQYKYLEWTGQEDLNASFPGMLVVDRRAVPRGRGGELVPGRATPDAPP